MSVSVVTLVYALYVDIDIVYDSTNAKKVGARMYKYTSKDDMEVKIELPHGFVKKKKGTRNRSKKKIIETKNKKLEHQRMG